MKNIIQLNYQNARKLGELNRQLIDDEGHRNTMSANELAKRMEAWLSSQYFCCGVMSDNEILAYCLYREEEEYFYIRQLFTSRNHRRKGLATKLLKYLEVNIVNRKPVRVDVLAGNNGAKEFYNALGYKLYCQTLEKNA